MLSKKQKNTLFLRLTGIALIIISILAIATDFLKDPSGKMDGTFLFLTIPFGVLLLTSRFEFIEETSNKKYQKEFQKTIDN